MTAPEDTKPKRAFATHTPKWQRFQTNLSMPTQKMAQEATFHPYQRQYSHVYAQRLAMLKPRCLQTAQAHVEKKKDNVVMVDRVLELREKVASIIVGTLVKEHDDASESPLLKNHKSRPHETLYLEDESGRVTLATEDIHQWCTGVVVAVQGTVQDGGILHVEHFHKPAPAPLASLPSDVSLEPSSAAPSSPPHLLLVSGLECGNPNVNSLPRDMLLAYLEGQLSVKAGAKVCRVLVAGGSTSRAEASEFGVKELDAWLAQLCAAGLPVDVLPGQNDPTTANWPQRPLHTSLLKYSSGTFSTPLLFRTPNPYASGVGDKYVVATDGRNVQDLQQSLLKRADPEKMTEEEFVPYSELEALQQTLEWAHICPTGPDSVPTMPHTETDPMVMEETPHLYVAGNCGAFDTQMVNIGDGNLQSRLVCIPKFSETGEAVLVNLETLDCEILRFEDDTV